MTIYKLTLDESNHFTKEKEHTYTIGIYSSLEKAVDKISDIIIEEYNNCNPRPVYSHKYEGYAQAHTWYQYQYYCAPKGNLLDFRIAEYELDK